MKILRFRDNLVPIIQSGKKNSTWRLFDDKNLSIDDEIELRKFGEEKKFGIARIINVIEKPFGELTEEDKRGHESYKNDEEMYNTYSDYYGTEVNPKTKVKIIWFELLERF